MSGKFPYSFRSPGAAELIGESQLLMVQVPVKCCVCIWGLQPQDCKKQNWKWMADDYLLNYSIILFDGKLKSPCPLPKNISLTVCTALLYQKEFVLLNTWRVKQQHLVCASIVFDKPWGNQHLFFLSWKYRRLLEVLALGMSVLVKSSWMIQI